MTGWSESSGWARRWLFSDLPFAVAVGVADGHAQQEAVKLRFGQGIRAGVFDGVLRRQHDEGAGQRVGDAVHRDLEIVHGLQQRRLRARRGAVDFVGEDDVGEERAGVELETVLAPVEDRHADDVRGQQVRRELDAAELAVNGLGQGARQRRFADAGHVLQQDVAARQQAHERELDGFALAHDRGFDIGQQRVELLPGGGGVLRGGAEFSRGSSLLRRRLWNVGRGGGVHQPVSIPGL